jgi:hypothetical protein
MIHESQFALRHEGESSPAIRGVAGSHGHARLETSPETEAERAVIEMDIIAEDVLGSDEAQARLFFRANEALKNLQELYAFDYSNLFDDSNLIGCETLSFDRPRIAFGGMLATSGDRIFSCHPEMRFQKLRTLDPSVNIKAFSFYGDGAVVEKMDGDRGTFVCRVDDHLSLELGEGIPLGYGKVVALSDNLRLALRLGLAENHQILKIVQDGLEVASIDRKSSIGFGGAAFSRSGETVALAEHSGKLRLLSLSRNSPLEVTGESSFTIHARPSSIEAVSFMPNGYDLLVGASVTVRPTVQVGYIHYFRMRQGPEGELNLHELARREVESPVWEIGFMPLERSILTISGKRNARIFSCRIPGA